jgi:pimeloyl-ACP methyl ester carboxylesterase
MSVTREPVHVRPHYFGPEKEELFGLFHPASRSAEPRAGVLLCNPFGQEAIRAHRTFKVLAERLARAGHPTLRFDYAGSGDSSGDDDSVTLAGLASNIGLADQHLRGLTINRPVLWLGLRLGATAAWLAAAACSAKPEKLILWDPIVDGPKYIAHLRQCHDAYVTEALSLPSRRPPNAKDVLEAIGFAIAPGFQAELQALSATNLPALPASVNVSVVCGADHRDGQAVLDRARQSRETVRLVPSEQSVDWLVESIDSGSLVPAKALQILTSLAGSGQ